jgi:hypothetical protein
MNQKHLFHSNSRRLLVDDFKISGLSSQSLSNLDE